VLKSLRKATDMLIDVHLMIREPVRYAEAFCRAGADLVNFHVEADSEEKILEAIRIARDLGKKTGVTVKPNTPAEAVLPFLPLVDLVLVMTVEPGFGGQHFMHDMLPKIAAIRGQAEAISNARSTPSAVSISGISLTVPISMPHLCSMPAI
jgi:ribulose-phosphate 3-epimerase